MNTDRMGKHCVLAIDDDIDLLEMLQSILSNKFDILKAKTGKSGLAILEKNSLIDIVLLDQRLPDTSGLQLLEKIQSITNPPPVIMLTAFHDLHLVIQAMKAGAYAYLPKPFENQILCQSIENAAKTRKQPTHFPNQTWINHIDKIATKDVTVLITGESGTGKERIAQRIHHNSQRHGGPFIAINCAAIPENLIETELFGHEKGAFTSAHERHIGRFEASHRGTLFLDEIAAMPLAMQVKLLRVLQEKTIERVGSIQSIHVDFRLIAATHTPLPDLVKSGRFRSDLFYRLNVVPIELPPLRERTDEIEPLLSNFIRKFNAKHHKTILAFTQQAKQKLKNYHWPGNIRELENLVERLVVLSEREMIDTPLLPPELALQHQAIVRPSHQLKSILKEIERDKLEQALLSARWNQSKAAKALGIHRTTLIAKMKLYGLSPK